MSNQTDEIKMNKEPTGVPGWLKVSIFFLLLVTIALIGAISYGYIQMLTLQQRATTNQNGTASLQTSVNDLRQMTEKSAALSTKQEQMIADWHAAQKGDLNKWYIAEAQYLVRLASDHLQFTHNTVMALTLLQRSDQILQKTADPSVVTLRQALAENITSLQQHPPIDVTGLYLQFAALNQQLDKLMLPASPLKANKKLVEPMPEETNTLSWWQKGLDKSWQALSKIVIIRNNTTNMLPLVMPDEKVFLYQNLHAQMESVMWAVLHHNNDVYQASLTRMIAWIQQYFDQDAQDTQNMLQSLANMQKISLQPQTVNIAATLQMFDKYFGE